MHDRSMNEVILRRRPVTLPPGTTVQQACQRMVAERVGAVLVTDPEGRLLGIFTGRDAIGRMLAEARDARRTTLAEVMTPDPESLPAETSAIEALHLMQDRGFRHIPVVAEGKLLGIVSRGDFDAKEVARLEADSYLWERL